MEPAEREQKVADLRHTLLELHKAMLGVQRIEYERANGRIETSGEFLGLVLNHPDFEWIRALSALIAQLDEWADDEAAVPEGYGGLVNALRDLIRREGSNAAFSAKYWKMVEDEPDVTVAHVKAWRQIGGGASGERGSSSPRAPGGSPAH
jgi:hypothetical protein